MLEWKALFHECLSCSTNLCQHFLRQVPVNMTNSLTALQSSPGRKLINRVGSPAWFFYCWLPLGIGLFMGSTQPGRSAAWPLGHSIAFWVVMCCLDWWLVDAGCRLARRLLRPLNPNLLTVLLAGSLVMSVLVVQPVNMMLIRGWYEILPTIVPRAGLPSALSIQLEQLFPSLAPWFLANYLFYRFAGLPRYGFEYGAKPKPKVDGRQASMSEALPVFLAKVRPDRRGELLALNAQGHYLRVITTGGEDLVLHTFGDAMKELDEGAGQRVHRSWWVAARALAHCELGSNWRLRHRDGLEIPVSRTFREQLRQKLDTLAQRPQRG
jgi:hypothetical protein